jgi:HK97 family phage prohead protease
MLHKTVDAAVVNTDQGEFTAIAAAYSTDRQGERIIPGAFASTLEAWRNSGKNIPLEWDHSGDARNVIGYVDPARSRETQDGLLVEGKLDINDSEVAREAWRSMKNNAIGMSFGYLVTDAREGSDGIKELTGLDVFEVTATATPANGDTRMLSTKSEVMRMLNPPDPEALGFSEAILTAMTQATAPPSLAEIKAKALELDIEGILSKSKPIQIKHFSCS